MESQRSPKSLFSVRAGADLHMRNNNIIGVIGGMGPMASVEFYNMLIQKSVAVFGAKNNDDFPEILIDSVPVPDFISDTEQLPAARSMLLKRVKQMNGFGVGEICIACNTAHILIDDFRKVSRASVISIMEEIAKRVKKNDHRRIGLLATPVTYKSDLYKDLKTDGRNLIIPSKKEQEKIEQFIRSVIAGEPLDFIQKRIAPFGHNFVSTHKLDAVVLGCTELPLIFPRDVPSEIIDTLDVLADAVLTHFYMRKI